LSNNSSVIATTPRLILRNWRESDVESFYALTSDPDVMRYIGPGETWDRALTEMVAGRRIRQGVERGYCLWAVELRESGEMIGQCGVQPLPDTDEIEIGWWLAKKHWGQGLATEAAQAALYYAMNNLGFKRIVAITQSPNRASSRIMERLGMHYEKTIERNGVENVLFYSIEV
jgi:[ribosomal protein S5]-alanine N-acetyltransferase